MVWTHKQWILSLLLCRTLSWVPLLHGFELLKPSPPFPASFQTSHTSSSVFAATSPTSISAAATSPTFLSALCSLWPARRRFVDYLLSSTASENLLTAPVAKKARKFAPPKSSKEVEQARKETIPKKHSLTSSIAYYYYYYVRLLWLLSYLDQIFATWFSIEVHDFLLKYMIF